MGVKRLVSSLKIGMFHGFVGSNVGEEGRKGADGSFGDFRIGVDGDLIVLM